MYRIMLLVIAALLVHTFLPMPAQAQPEERTSIITYPVPNLATVRYLAQSPKFSLRVGASIPDTDVFVYAYSNCNNNGAGPDISFSAFAFSGGPVKVEIASTNIIKSAAVWPLEFGITPTVDGQKVSFTLTEPRKVMVVLNFGKGLDYFPLFADPPETNAPSAQAPGVVYYGPGVHELGTEYTEIPTKTTVYLAPGAIVKGCFRIGGSSNKVSDVSIKGRGMIFRGDLPWNSMEANRMTAKQAITTGPNFVERLTIQDIMTIGGPFWTEYLGGRQVTVRNQKIISPFICNSDGVSLTGVTDGLVENCFVLNNDDALISQSSSNVRFVNNITGNYGNGNALYQCYGWGAEHNILVENLYVMGVGGSVIDITHPGSDELTGMIVKDIYAHGCGAFLSRRNDYVVASAMGGGFSDLYFENVRLFDLSKTKRSISGRNAEMPVQYLTVNGLYRDGVKIGSLADANVVASEYVTNVVFDAPHVMITEPHTRACLLQGESSTIRAEALGFTSAVDRVEFFIDGSLAGQDRAAPYDYPWTNMSEGTHHLQAIAFAGKSRTESRGNLYVDVKTSVADLILNGGFEGGKAFWQACYGGTLEEESKIVRTGRKSLKISGRTTTAHVPIQRVPYYIPPAFASKPKPAGGAASPATPERTLALGKTYSSKGTPSSTNSLAACLFDGDAKTHWCVKEYADVWAEVDFGTATTFNKVKIGPDYEARVTGYKVEYFDAGVWKTACTGGGDHCLWEDRCYEAYVRNASTTSAARMVFQYNPWNGPYTRIYGDWTPVGSGGWTKLRFVTAGVAVPGLDSDLYIENSHATETFYIDDVKGARFDEPQPATKTFPAVTGTKARLYITSARGWPDIPEMGIYREPVPAGGR